MSQNRGIQPIVLLVSLTTPKRGTFGILKNDECSKGPDAIAPNTTAERIFSISPEAGLVPGRRRRGTQGPGQIEDGLDEVVLRTGKKSNKLGGSSFFDAR